MAQENGKYFENQFIRPSSEQLVCVPCDIEKSYLTENREGDAGFYRLELQLRPLSGGNYIPISLDDLDSITFSRSLGVFFGSSYKEKIRESPDGKSRHKLFLPEHRVIEAWTNNYTGQVEKISFGLRDD